MTPIEQVQAKRRSLGWTYQDVADRAGMHAPNVSRILKGEVDPKLSTAEALARAVGLKLNCTRGIAPPGKPRKPRNKPRTRGSRGRV
jgi:transcriptional regulator with XRE-family HTH domain